mmetsp:Transcript_30663/g.54828  ORF Transcript_30663/g.54828 Transcript_30663/m.54828 type:complete len:226 (+) Transcript_30663:281-958(+)
MMRVSKGPGTGRVRVSRRLPSESPKILVMRALMKRKASTRRSSVSAFAVRWTLRLSSAGAGSPFWGIAKSTQFVTVPAAASTTLETVAAPRVLFLEKVASAAVVNRSRQAPCSGQSVAPAAVPNPRSGRRFGVSGAICLARLTALSAAASSSGDMLRNTPSASKLRGARDFLSSSPPFTPKSTFGSPPDFACTTLKSAMAANSSCLKASLGVIASAEAASLEPPL